MYNIKHTNLTYYNHYFLYGIICSNIIYFYCSMCSCGHCSMCSDNNNPDITDTITFDHLRYLVDRVPLY